MKTTLYVLGLVVALILSCCQECTAEECSADHFQCADAQCVNSGAVCDGHTDCEDGSDELQRCECASDQFICGNGQCVGGAAFCDGSTECLDESDEDNSHCHFKNVAKGWLIPFFIFFVFCCGGGFLVNYLILVYEERKKTRVQRVAGQVSAAPGPPTSDNNISILQPTPAEENSTDTVLEDAQLSTGVCPPSYDKTGDYKSVNTEGFSEELSNQMSGNERVVIPIDFRDQSQYDVPPPYSNTDV